MAATYNDIPVGPVAVVAVGTVVGKVPGDRRRKRVRVTGDASYPAGGYPAPSLNQLGFLVQIDYCDITNENMGTAGANEWFWNTVTQKLQLLVLATGNELAPATNVSTAFCDCVFEGF